MKQKFIAVIGLITVFAILGLLLAMDVVSLPGKDAPAITGLAIEEAAPLQVDAVTESPRPASAAVPVMLIAYYSTVTLALAAVVTLTLRGTSGSRWPDLAWRQVRYPLKFPC